MYYVLPVRRLIHLIEPSYIWHDKLGHVNYGAMCMLVHSNSVRDMQVDHQQNMKFMEAKLVETSFWFFNRSTKPLCLNNNDICGLKYV